MTDSPMAGLIGFNKKHAQRAVRWLRDRNILAVYDSSTRELRAPVLTTGRNVTDKALRDAYDATL